MATTQQLIDALNKGAKKTIGGVGLKVPDPERLPTGVFALDMASGGGFPLGRCSEIYGLEASMKTTLLLKLIAQHQRQFPKKRCVFIDVEGHTTQAWAERFDVDWNNMLYIQPETAESIVNMVEGMMVAEDIGLIGIDSIAAMVSQKELDADAETANVGTSGLVVNKLYRKVTHSFNEANRHGITPTLVLINQIRYKMGVMYGSPETTVGGPAIRFLASLRVRVNGSDEFEKKTDKLPTYKHVRGSITKNKVPILAKAFEYMIALKDLPELQIKFGQSYDWNTVLLYLKKLEMLTQGDKSGWTLKMLGHPEQSFKTQDEMKNRYHQEKAFGMAVRKAVIVTALANGDPITESDVEDK